MSTSAFSVENCDQHHVAQKQLKRDAKLFRPTTSHAADILRIMSSEKNAMISEEIFERCLDACQLLCVKNALKDLGIMSMQELLDMEERSHLDDVWSKCKRVQQRKLETLLSIVKDNYHSARVTDDREADEYIAEIKRVSFSLEPRHVQLCNDSQVPEIASNWRNARTAEQSKGKTQDNAKEAFRNETSSVGLATCQVMAGEYTEERYIEDLIWQKKLTRMALQTLIDTTDFEEEISENKQTAVSQSRYREYPSKAGSRAQSVKSTITITKCLYKERYRKLSALIRESSLSNEMIENLERRINLDAKEREAAFRKKHRLGAIANCNSACTREQKRVRFTCCEERDDVQKDIGQICKLPEHASKPNQDISNMCQEPAKALIRRRVESTSCNNRNAVVITTSSSNDATERERNSDISETRIVASVSLAGCKPSKAKPVQQKPKSTDCKHRNSVTRELDPRQSETRFYEKVKSGQEQCKHHSDRKHCCRSGSAVCKSKESKNKLLQSTVDDECILYEPPEEYSMDALMLYGSDGLHSAEAGVTADRGLYSQRHSSLPAACPASPVADPQYEHGIVAQYCHVSSPWSPYVVGEGCYLRDPFISRDHYVERDFFGFETSHGCIIRSQEQNHRTGWNVTGGQCHAKGISAPTQSGSFTPSSRTGYMRGMSTRNRNCTQMW